MKYLFTLICLLFFTMSCSVSESIVFNEHMGGVFKSTFDMSQILAITNESNLETEKEKASKAVDTTIVFNQFLEQYKDSISALPMDKQKQLYAMKNVVIDMQMDEDKGIFNFTMNKPFANFDELKLVNEQLDGAMNIAHTISEKDSATTPAPKDQMDELTKSDPVVYSFSNNTFTRYQPKKEDTSEDFDGEDSSETQDMTDMFKGQFDDLFKATFYTMTYTFPKPIKSVSSKEAVLSEDRKTMTLKTDLSAINKDPELMNLEIILKD